MGHKVDLPLIFSQCINNGMFARYYKHNTIKYYFNRTYRFLVGNFLKFIKFHKTLFLTPVLNLGGAFTVFVWNYCKLQNKTIRRYDDILKAWKNFSFLHPKCKREIKHKTLRQIYFNQTFILTSCTDFHPR